MCPNNSWGIGSINEGCNSRSSLPSHPVYELYPRWGWLIPSKKLKGKQLKGRNSDSLTVQTKIWKPTPFEQNLSRKKEEGLYSDRLTPLPNGEKTKEDALFLENQIEQDSEKKSLFCSDFFDVKFNFWWNYFEIERSKSQLIRKKWRRAHSVLYVSVISLEADRYEPITTLYDVLPLRHFSNN